MSKISFYQEGTQFKLSSKKETVKWMKTVIEKYSFYLGSINYIFCSDEYLLKINQDHLNHDYYTDIITFNYVENKEISGDLFISIDRVKDNAKSMKNDFKDELDRVMIHGILHLLGFNDQTDSEAQEIRAQEDFCLTLRSQI